MNAPYRSSTGEQAYRLDIAAPAWLMLAFAASLLVNALVSALLAAALLLHLAGRL